MTINVTVENCRKAAYKIVQKHGADFRYEAPDDPRAPDGKCTELRACVNVFAEKPSCIVGRILAELGVPVRVIPIQEGSSATLGMLERREYITIELHASGYLGVLQGVQDAEDEDYHGERGKARKTWGAALVRGDEYLREMGLI